MILLFAFSFLASMKFDWISLRFRFRDCHIAEAAKLENMDLNLGEEQGLTERSVISNEVLQKILQGVENGNKDNIYFYGLLKLYGISMSQDPTGAAQQFLRASSLGHKEATTAYGVIMLTGALGSVDYLEALKYFREGVTQDDMVSFLASLIELP